MDLRYSDRLTHIQAVITAVLEAADPYRLVKEALQHQPGQLTVNTHEIEIPVGGRLWLLAIGKAASPMARAAAEELRIDSSRVILIRPKSDRSICPDGWQVFSAGHPLPTAQSLAAGAFIERRLTDLHADDAVIVLLSGGGSALLELPKSGIHLEDLRRINLDLLRSGAPIQAINVVRKALSLMKAGGLARMAAPARVITLILSDVVGDDLSVIASGPTVAQPADPVEARQILQAYDLWSGYSNRVKRAILSNPGETTIRLQPLNILLANNKTVQSAAAEATRRLGFRVDVADKPLAGEARLAGQAFARSLIATQTDNYCYIQGGETTVTVHGEGTGGRNQEFAVAAGQVLEAEDRVAIASFATDGIDGPTDAAGAIVDSGFVRHAHALGLKPDNYLENNDTYSLLKQLDVLIRIGPTHTNLNDIAFGLRYAI